MLPTILTGADAESERARYAIVRLDTLERVPGLILSANCETGMCVLKRRVPPDDKEKHEEHQFGPGGIRIVAK